MRTITKLLIVVLLGYSVLAGCSATTGGAHSGYPDYGSGYDQSSYGKRGYDNNH